MTHHTKGIVLRAVKYGDTSIIATVFTELFGVQSYIVKGVRTTSKRGQTKANSFQPGSLLQMVVYHNELKNLQFIKEYEWAYLYNNIFYDVIKNSVALFIVELLQHSLRQPEPNPELFYFVEETLTTLDKTDMQTTANLPLYFSLQLASILGFQLQGNYSTANNILDLTEGYFVPIAPLHTSYIDGPLASFMHSLANMRSIEQVNTIGLNKNIRRDLLQAVLTYFALHISDFGELKSMQVLREVIS